MKNRLREITVQAKDTYNPEDYVMVHARLFDGMREVIRRVHGDACACIYCGRAANKNSPDQAGEAQ